MKLKKVDNEILLRPRKVGFQFIINTIKNFNPGSVRK